MKKILWVEDDYIRLKNMMRPLENSGFHVEYIPDFPSYKKIEDLATYDLYIIDLILPQKNHGEEIPDEEYREYPGLDIIRDLEKYNKPIIVFSIASDQTEVSKELNKFKNVKMILYKGNIFPSDLKEDVYSVLGINK